MSASTEQWLGSVPLSDGRNQIAIRFKYHAIWYWFDSNFNDSIQDTRHLNRNLEIMNTHSHYSLLSQILLSGRGLWTARSIARKSAAPKMEIPMITIGRSGLCLNMLFVVSGFEIWDLELQGSRFWCEIRFKIWDLAWKFESPVKKIWHFRVRFDLRFAHHC